MKGAKLKVKLQNNPYDILISEREQDFLLSFKNAVKPAKTVFIITDTNVSAIYLKRFSSLLAGAGFVCKSAIIEAGEQGKSLKTLGRLYDAALKNGIGRKSCVAALGGGVVGDVAGFFCGHLYARDQIRAGAHDASCDDRLFCRRKNGR